MTRRADCGSLGRGKQTPPPEYLMDVEVVALRHHRHRNPRLVGLRHDLPLLRLAPTSASAANRSAAQHPRLLLNNQHQLSVHLNRSGHLPRTHFPSAQLAKTATIPTDGLPRDGYEESKPAIVTSQPPPARGAPWAPAFPSPHAGACRAPCIGRRTNGVDYVLIARNQPGFQNQKAPENVNVFRGFFGCGGRI